MYLKQIWPECVNWIKVAQDWGQQRVFCEHGREYSTSTTGGGLPGYLSRWTVLHSVITKFVPDTDTVTVYKILPSEFNENRISGSRCYIMCRGKMKDIYQSIIP